VPDEQPATEKESPWEGKKARRSIDARPSFRRKQADRGGEDVRKKLVGKSFKEGKDYRQGKETAGPPRTKKENFSSIERTRKRGDRKIE